MISWYQWVELIGIILIILIMIRNEGTYRLRMHIINTQNLRVFKKLPSYLRLVFSFRSLSIEHWEKKLLEEKNGI